MTLHIYSTQSIGVFDTLLLCTLGESEWEISLHLYDHRLRSHADTDEAFCDRVNCVAHEHKINN